MLQADRSAESAGRLENLTELTRAMEEYETLGAFLEHVSLVMDNDEAAQGDKVTIMTIHAAKGLEFDIVFLAGWEEGVFPSQRALDEGGLASLEEERRLAYVAITRARRRCTIIHAANRRIYGQWTSSIPSRFVAELPKAHIEEETTMTGGESLWRAQWSERADPFAHLGRRPVDARQHARPRLAARASRAAHFNREPHARHRSPRLRGQPRQPGPHRPRARPARVPRQVRLRHDRRDRRQQARDRLRACRAQEGARQLRQRGVIRMKYGAKEKAFSEPFADQLAKDPAFLRWVLDRTKFRNLKGARVLADEMKKKRSKVATTWSASHYTESCRCFGCEGSETDILAIVADANGQTVAMHIEVKQPSDSFNLDRRQAERYPVRAACWVSKAPHNVVSHVDACTMLLCSSDKLSEFASEADHFDTVITFEEIARDFPAATASHVKPAPPVSPFAPGVMVEHSKFGRGIVVLVEGNKLEIEFEKAGRKKVLDSFVSVSS